MSLEDFNALPEAEARTQVATCLDVPRWVDTVLAGRPYADLDALLAVASIAAELDDEELETALARHPRIGERAGAGHDAAFSAKEQSGVDQSDAEVAERLVLRVVEALVQVALVARRPEVAIVEVVADRLDQHVDAVDEAVEADDRV